MSANSSTKRWSASHRLGRTVDWVFGSLQVFIGAIALGVAWRSLTISAQVVRDSRRERERADERERLMWMQTLLNELKPIENARAANNEREYVDRQRWMRTCLATGALRHL